MKKYILILIVIMLATLLIATIGQTKKYIDAEYNFSFNYPRYADALISDKAIDSTVRTIDLNMQTLEGLNPIMVFKVSKIRRNFFEKGNIMSEKFGNIYANKYNNSIAGGDFVIYEIHTTDQSWLYVEIDKHFVDRKFNDQFQGDELNELVKGANMFQKVKESFYIKLPNIMN